jgi:hypothetical protein
MEEYLLKRRLIMFIELAISGFIVVYAVAVGIVYRYTRETDVEVNESNW